MKIHFVKIFTFVLLLLLIPGILIGSALALPEVYQETYYAELSNMYTRLTEAEGRKLVLIGGSNIAFGIDTVLLESILQENGCDYTVCPLGLYAAIGTTAMLELSEDVLQDGDIVILAIEPTSESMSTYFGATAYWKCAEKAPKLLTPLSSSYKSALLGNFTEYLQQRYATYRSGELPEAEGVYTSAAFDENCNLIYPREGNTMALGYDTGMPIDLTSVQIAEDFAREVNHYCDTAVRKGAAVYMSFCPMNSSALINSSEAAINDYFTLCNETFHCPIISAPDHYIFQSGWFYDSNVHLNSAGAKLRTYRLAEDILAQLGHYSALEYLTPQMPSPIAPAPTVDAEDNGSFTFSALESDAAYLVSGLTDKGCSLTELTIPAVHEGKPVVGFTPNALGDAALLEQLRVPESIESMPDALFASCPRLVHLILEHKNAPCSITSKTFDGANQLKILVPAEAYPLYRDGFGCETNIWEQFMDRIYTY
jgi:hypothetical protein